VTSATVSDGLRSLQTHPPNQILVLSDLHLGEGQDAVTGSYARTENFFADSLFSRLLEAHDPSVALLVLNGDTFDFLRITAWPRSRAQVEDWSQALAALGVSRKADALAASISSKERAFGLRTDDYKSVWKVLRIARGHPRFFIALGRWVERGGTILLVTGNHDVELYWPLVQGAIRAAIGGSGGSSSLANARTLFCHDAFTIANIYGEHGHRFEPMTAVIGPPTLPGMPTQLNLPVGSFVNRYLINPIERLEPFLDNVKPVTNVLWALLRKHPLQALRILWRSWRFILRAIEARRVLTSAGVFLFLGALLVPVLTILAIVLAFAWPAAGQWAVDTFGRYRTLLSLVGLAAPYIIGLVRDLFPDRKPVVGEDTFAEGVYTALKARAPGAPGATQFAILGHTHEQDVQSLPALSSARVLYLNTGTWIPLWDEDRPDLAGKILHPFIRFTKNTDGAYTHEYLEWADGGGPTEEPLILERANTIAR